MCTVTWLRKPDGYLLFCNRDERSSRQPALGPEIKELNGVKYVAPVDGDHGGSWIGVNEYGLTLCLLNRYGDAALDESRDFISRGLLLIELFDCTEVSQVTARVDEFALDRYRPFDLLAISRDPHSALFSWTGSDSRVNSNADNLIPLTSTSLLEPGIAIERKRQFDLLGVAGALDVTSLERYHRSHLPTRGAYSVCMHRQGASTVSFSKVEITTSELLFEYESGPPCESANPTRVGLTIRQPQ